MRLHTFPVPLPDETLFSLVARHHVLNGARSPEYVLEALFGRRHAFPAGRFPGHLDVLAARLPECLRLSADALIDRHTTLPFVGAFAPPERVLAARRAMRVGGAIGVHARLGMLRREPVLARPGRRFCPACLAQDVALYGQPYWHRVHQLPFTYICPEHDRLLHAPHFELGVSRRYSLELPSVEAPSYEVIADLPELARDSARLIARECAVLLTRAPALDRRDVARVYRATLKEAFGTRSGAAGLRELSHELKTRHGALLSSTGLETNGAAPREAPLGSIFSLLSPTRMSAYSLTHVLVATTLFGGIDAFLTAVEAQRADEPSAAGGHGERLVRASRPARSSVDSDRLSQLLGEGLSLAAAARALGCSTYCVRIAARRHRLRTDALSSVGLETRNRVEAGLRDGEGRLAIAARCRVSASFIDRLLCANPALKQQRSKALQEISRKRNRSTVDDYLARYPGSSFKELRLKTAGAFVWLLRHDSDWVHERLKRRLLRKSIAPSRTDWALRDRRAKDALVVAVSELDRRQDQRPLRRTVAYLFRCAQLEPSLARNLDRMPVTSQYLRSIVDSDDSWKRRRILWAIDHLARSGRQILAWRVCQLAALRHANVRDVETVLSESRSAA